MPALSAVLPITRQAVAKHLATLDHAGLVERAPATGREVRYRLRAGALTPASAWLADAEAAWEGRLVRLKDAVESGGHSDVGVREAGVCEAAVLEAAVHQAGAREPGRSRRRAGCARIGGLWADHGSCADGRPTARHARLRQPPATSQRRTAGERGREGDRPVARPRRGQRWFPAEHGRRHRRARPRLRSRRGGAGRGWFYYVNGVQASKGPAATSVHPGDHVWWDLHDASQTEDIPAVVGSFPEPFLNGVEGTRLPIADRMRVRRPPPAARSQRACARPGCRRRVAAIGSGGAPETLRVMVGPWSHLNGDLEAESIGHGPRASGVYARFSADGQALTLLDEQGQPVRDAVTATRGSSRPREASRKRPCGWSPGPTTPASSSPRARSTGPRSQDHFAVGPRPPARDRAAPPASAALKARSPVL